MTAFMRSQASHWGSQTYLVKMGYGAETVTSLALTDQEPLGRAYA